MVTNKNNNLSADSAGLRRKAEEQLRDKTYVSQPLRTMDELQRLVHELEVHQIELVMQNTELRNARDETEKALGMYTDLYDFAPVGYITVGRDGAIRAANLTATILFGIERSRLIGRQFLQFIANDARPSFSAFLRETFKSRIKGVCEVALLKEGAAAHPPVAQIEALTAATGQECRIAVIDITERKWAEDKLRISEHQLATAQRLVHLGSWQWNSIADTITGSEEFYRIFGLTFSSYDGFLKQVHPDDRDRVNKAVQDTLDRHTPYNVFYRIVRPDGTIRIIHALGEAIANSAGMVVRMNGTAQDITERRQLEKILEMLHIDLASHAAELEAANIELEAFNYTVSHDLRSPLTAINSYLQILQDRCGSNLDDEAKGYIHEMYEGSNRMNRLIETLLGFSHITHVKMGCETVDLSSMAKAVAAELKLSEPECRVAFEITDEIIVDGDSGLLHVVLDNLIGNAWKFANNRDGAVIEFGVKLIDGASTCYVRDNGPGFPKEHAGKLFTPFQRLPGTVEFKGHGIGLATVERIIKRHGGKVWAEGEPGKGACFYFTLSTNCVSIST